MLEMGKTIKNGIGARPNGLDIGLLISLLLIDESAGTGREGDIVYNIMPTTMITDILKYLGANERNTVVSGYDNMMYCLGNILVNRIVPVRLRMSPK
jgi:hypothetical protein